MGTSADISRFLARLPPKLAARFDAEQLAALELHFGMRHRAGHVVDWGPARGCSKTYAKACGLKGWI